MTILESLTQEYIEETYRYSYMRIEHENIIEGIKIKAALLAKFSVGDKVITDQGIGIIRSIKAFFGHKKSLSIGYCIGKITKKGVIHKTEDICYTGYLYKESDIKLKE